MEEDGDLDCLLGQSLDKQDPMLIGAMNNKMVGLRIATRRDWGRRTRRRYLDQSK
jgi:hypothetical protein